MMRLFLFLTFFIVNLYSIDLVSHRGYYKSPENSLESIKSALLKGYEGVEIDIQPLKNVNKVQDYALLHDLVVKRELSTTKENELKNSLHFTKDQWKSLKKKNRDGSISKENGTTLSEALDTFSKFAKSSQYLNIEIKSPKIDVESFYYKIKPYLNNHNIQVSSNYLKILEKIREYDKRIYLGFVFLPNKNSFQNKVDSSVTNLMNKFGLGKYNQNYKEKSELIANKYDEKISKQYFDSIINLSNKLGNNFGIHIDYLDAKSNIDKLISLNTSKNYKLYLYSLDSTTPEEIANYFNNFKIKIDGIITDFEKTRPLLSEQVITKSNFSHKKAAILSKEVYESYINFKSKYKTSKNKVGKAEYNSVKFFAIDEKDYTVIAFRGTQNIKNVKTDLNIKENSFLNFKDTKVHSGFYNVALQSKEILKNILKKDKKIYITGHSLGGAVSILLGSILHHKGYDTEVISFGAPPVGNDAFVEKITSLKHFRYAHNEDIIPKLNQKTAEKIKNRIDTIQEVLEIVKTGKEALSFKSILKKAIIQYLTEFGELNNIELINHLKEKTKNLFYIVSNIKYDYIHDHNNVVLLKNKLSSSEEESIGLIQKFISRNIQYHDMDTYIAYFFKND